MAQPYDFQPNRSTIAQGGGVTAYLEACESYQKQSYRNRCEIYAASGRQSLIVPVVHDGGTFSHPITKIRIDWSKPWLQQHERAIVSAYGKAAFFDYYWDGLFDLLKARPETLWELNLSILRFLLDSLGLSVDLRFTKTFIPSYKSGSCPTQTCSPGGWQKDLPFNPALDAVDLREVIHPKRPDDILERTGMKKPYFQVFACKHGFIANLSVMDLLFNMGPESVSYIII